MKNTILKIEQLSKKYYPIIKNFSIIEEFSIKRLQYQLNLKIEKEKIRKFIIKNADDSC